MTSTPLTAAPTLGARFVPREMLTPLLPILDLARPSSRLSLGLSRARVLEYHHDTEV